MLLPRITFTRFLSNGGLFGVVIAALLPISSAMAQPPPASPSSEAPAPTPPPASDKGTPPNAVIAIGAGAGTEGLRRGLDALGRHDWEEAAREFDAFVKENPSNVDALNYYGFALLMQGKFDDAVTTFQSVLKQQPDNVTALLNLGNALLSKPGAVVADYTQASEVFSHVLMLKANSPEAQTGVGTAALRAGQWEQSANAYRALLDNPARNAKDDAAVYASLGFALSHQNKASEAIEALEKSVELKPEQSHAQALLGALRLEQGRTDDALTALEASRKLDREDYSTLINLGHVYTKQKRYSDAADAYEQAAQSAEKRGSQPDRVVALYNQGGVLQLLGNDKAALDVYNTLLALDARNFGAQVNSAFSLYRLGQVDAAIVRFTDAAATQPNAGQVWQGLGKAYEQKRDTRRAATAWVRAAALTSDPVEKYRFYEVAASHWLRLKQWEQLQSVAKRMIGLQPSSATPHTLLGLAYQVLSETEPSAAQAQGLMLQAMQQLRTSARLNPRSAVVQNNLGVLHERRGEIPEALASYRRALAIDPGFAEARQNLGRYGQGKTRKPRTAKMGTLP